MKTITICGSMQFRDEMIRIQNELESMGWTVFTPNFSEKTINASKSKTDFISDHFDRIRSSDAILVANFEKNGVGGYIGSNTLMEIAVAFLLKKTIYILNKLGAQQCQEEVEALATTFLEGDITKL